MTMERKTGKTISLIALAGVTLLMGLATLKPAQAQEVQTKGRIIIRDGNGERVIELGPDQLGPVGPGGIAVIAGVGPDGKVTTFATGAGGLVLGDDLNGSRFVLGGANGMGMRLGMQIIDPGRSYIHELIQRDDVRAQLYLTAAQKEALDAAQKGQMQAIQQQAAQTFSNIKIDLNGKSPEEIQQFVTERAQKMQEQIQNLASNRDKQLAAILKPDQMARLKQLDLQWRGPLAMGVKEVAEQEKLTPEQMAPITDLLKEYRQEIAKRLRPGGANPINLQSVKRGGSPSNNSSTGTSTNSTNSTTTSGNGSSISISSSATGSASASSSASTTSSSRASGSASNGSSTSGGSSSKSSDASSSISSGISTIVSSPAALEEMRQKMAQTQKEIEKLRKTLGDKALNGLSSEQRTQWNTLTGKPFIFRTEN